MSELLVAELTQTALCEGLDDDEVQRLANAGRVEFWPSGAVVMEEGTDGPRLVVMLEGAVTIEKSDSGGVTHVIGSAGAGAILGEMSLLAGTARTATVRATSQLRVFAIDKVTFEGMVEDGDPAALKLGISIATVLAHRLGVLNERFVEVLEELRGEDGAIQEFARFRQELFTRWNF